MGLSRDDRPMINLLTLLKFDIIWRVLTQGSFFAILLLLGVGLGVSCGSAGNVPTSTSYTLTATATVGGSISPTGAVLVNAGTDQPFTFNPDSGYALFSVAVDGVDKGIIDKYTFLNVESNHTISATFRRYSSHPSITAGAGNGGSISPSGVVAVTQGSSETFTITPNAGYLTESVVVDDIALPATVTYTFSNVWETHTIYATFVPSTSLH